MAIARVKKGNSVYLYNYKNIRVNGKVKHVYQGYIGVERNGKLKEGKHRLDALELSNTKRYGDIAVLWDIAETIMLPETIDQIVKSNMKVSVGKLITIMAINRLIDSKSLTQLERWLLNTGMDEIAGIDLENMKKHQFLRALDAVCNSEEDHIEAIENALYDRLMERGDKLDEIIAYDLTSTYFHGTKCPIAYIGYSRDRVSGKKQIEIAIVGAKKNRYPLFHRVYAGDVLDLKTVGRFLAELNRYKIKSKWILWDAGMVSEETLRWADEQEYGIICGLKASMKAYNEIIEKSGEFETAENYMKKEGNGALYVKDFEYPIFGKERYVTVILNTDLMMRTRVERNESIREALKALGDLKLTGNKKEDMKKINVIIKDINRYISVKIKDEKIVTEFNEKELMKEENRDGKRIVMSTKPGLSGREIVETYFSKDFIEKIFRSLKSDIEIRPIRHRIPERVRAYVFVCVTAYRLKVELEKRFEDQKVEMDVDEFLEKMGEVEKVKIELGKENKIRYLNMNRDLLSVLKKIRMGSLLK